MKQFDRAALAQILNEGISALKLDLSAAQAEQLLDYLALLAKWNSVYNLTSVRDPLQMLTLHVLDSLAAVPAFAEAKNVLDVGAGGGLPGMVLAIARPDIKVSMIDTVHKKNRVFDASEGRTGPGQRHGVHQTGGTAGSAAEIRCDHLARFCRPVRLRQLVEPRFGGGRAIHRLERGGTTRRARATAGRLESDEIDPYSGARAECGASSGVYNKNLKAVE